MKYLLDTHAWIWWNARPDRLPAKVMRLLSEPARYEELLLSAASVWECCEYLRAGRLGFSMSPDLWVETALDMPGLRLVPLSSRISCLTLGLPEPAPPDPIDRILAATAREENAIILTGDSTIQKYPHVKTLW